MKLNLLLTGNELMAGDIIDSNSSMIAQRFAPFGWRVSKKVTVGDDMDELCAEIRSLSEGADVLIINGGLGPTVDDLTAQAMAKVAGVAVREHPEALKSLEAWCERRNFPLTAANHKQAVLPEGCDILQNTRGSAVGIAMTHKGCLLLATPGVPSELDLMLDNAVLPLLEQRFDHGFIRTLRLGVFGLGESGIQEMINRELGDWPENIELGFRASMPVLEVKLTCRESVDPAHLAHWRARVEALMADHLLGEVPVSLPSALLDACKQKQLSLCTAESCTGGLIAAQLTGISGSSAVFQGGIVSYSNKVKMKQLGVEGRTLERDGAVSEAVVRQMLGGALSACDADVGIAVTGIAGPDGGSPDKPVGTVWIAWGGLDSMQAIALCLPFERLAFQRWVAALSLDLLRRQVLALPQLPNIVQRFIKH